MTGGVATKLERIWYPGAGGSGSPLALRLAAALYAGAQRLRTQAFDRGLLPARRLSVPCVSVGNLTVGGTGKTPLVDWLLGELTLLGAHPGVVSRGYGGSARGPERVTGGGDRAAARRFGDEPALLARRFPEAPVCVGRDRHAAGVLAVKLGATVVVADDALQHRWLARDLDIVVIDATRGFGNGRLLPAGPLREPPGALARAGVVVLNRVGAAPALEALRRAVARLAPRASLVESDLEFAGWRAVPDGAPAELPAGSRVYAFSGIANPASFRRTLESLGMRLAGWEVFRDHHAYGRADIRRLEGAASAAGAAAVVTTAKDAVRLPPWAGAVPLYRAEVKLAMIRGRETLWETLRSIVAGGRG